ncbi:MAG: type II toxin-antitoxin system HicB family antitoxin [Desulfuromonadales bacterium]
MNAMMYKGYAARVEFDPDDRIFTGRLAGIDDIVTFHGESVTELEREFQIAVDGYLEMSQQLGKQPQKPYSGRVMLRVPSEIHAAAAIAADASGKSLNQWATEIIRRAVS